MKSLVRRTLLPLLLLCVTSSLVAATSKIDDLELNVARARHALANPKEHTRLMTIASDMQRDVDASRGDAAVDQDRLARVARELAYVHEQLALTPERNATAATITGSVVDDATGLPISGAVVRAGGQWGPIASTVSGADGLFLLRAWTGSMTIDVSAAGYGSQSQVVSVSWTTPATINFRLRLGGAIKGRAFDRVLAGGPSYFELLIYDTSGALALYKYVSDNSGAYDTGMVLTPGTYYVKVVASSYVPQLYDGVPCPGCNPLSGTPVVVTSGETREGIDFPLDPTYGITLRVVSDGASPTPIVGARIELYAGQYYGTTLYSDLNGYARAWYGSGTYFVLADGTGSGYERALYDGIACPTSCDVTSGTPIVHEPGWGYGTDVTVRLRSVGSRVSGRLTAAATNLPVKGATVTAYRSSGAFEQIASTTSSITGDYQLGMPAVGGSYFLEVRAANLETQRYSGIYCPQSCAPGSGTPVQLQPNETLSGIDLQLRSLPKIHGVISGANGPVAAEIRLYDDEGRVVRSQTTSADGAFELFPGEGTFYLVAYATDQLHLSQVFGGASCNWDCDITTGTPLVTVNRQDREANITLTRGVTIEGDVEWSADGSAVGGYVHAYDRFGRSVTGGQIDFSGHYSFRVVPATYYLAASAEGFISEFFGGQQCSSYCNGIGGTPVEAVSSAVTANFTLESANGLIRGRIQDARSGAALAGVVVKVTGEGKSYNVTTSTNGEFEIRDSRMLSPGNYRLEALSETHRDQLYGGIDCEHGCEELSGGVVTVGANQSVTANFQLSPLLVFQISPLRGATAGGEQITIDGAAFDAGTVVTFDGVPAPISSSTPTRIVLTTPAHVAGVVDMTIVTSDGLTSSLAKHFEYSDGGISSPRLVKDINPNSVTAGPIELVVIAGERKIAFVGYGNVEGSYVGVSDEGIVEVLPMTDPPLMSVTAGGVAYILTNFPPQGSARRELWRSDGTAAGTTRVELDGFVSSIVEDEGEVFANVAMESGRKLIQIAPGGAHVELMSYSGGRACCFERLDTLRYFVATVGGKVSLFRTDGTAAGTSLVASLDEIGGAPASITAGSMLAHNGALFFTVTNEFFESGLFKTDGTAAGTTLLKTFDGSPSSLVLFDGRVHFGARDALWASDGTVDGTVAVIQHSQAYFSGLTPLGDTLLYTLFEYSYYRGLWRTDGTSQGTYRLSYGYYNQDVPVAVLGDKAIFPTHPYPALEYFVTDGTTEGTVLLAPSFADGVLSKPLVKGSSAYFAPGSDGDFIWKTDGTVAGTARLAGQSSLPGAGGSSDPSRMTAWNSKLYFGASDGDGPGVFVSDGSESGTLLLKRGALVSNIAATTSRLFFTLRVNGGTELWGSDGSAAGTFKIDLASTAVSESLVSIGSAVLFTTYGGGLWRTDGTSAGTFKLLDGGGQSFGAAGGIALFWRSNELWRTNGTLAGTFLVKAFTAYTTPTIWVVDGQFFFSVQLDYSTTYLWSSDGTAQGTKLLKRIPGPISSAVNASGELVFLCQGSSELWKSNGTAAGTSLAQLLAGSRLLAASRGRLFVAMEGMTLGVTDGYQPPTSLARISDSYYYSPVSNTVSGSELLFMGFVRSLAQTLMRTDGTIAGTRLHHDFDDHLHPNPYQSTDFVVLHDKIFFAAWTEEHGRELRVMDVLEQRPAPLSITPSSGPSSGGTAVEVVGTNFAPSLHFTIGGKRVTEATSDTDSATMKTTAMAPGQLVDVVIHDGVDITLRGAFFSDFLDVPEGHGFHDFVEMMLRRAISAGCGNGNFCVDASLTRGQMAVLLLRSKFGPAYQPAAASGTLFSDVPASHVFAAWIEALAREGITGGCGGTNFCPDGVVTRAQMAVFLLVAKEGAGYVPPAATGMFDDVEVTSPFRPWIEELARRGITGGCGPRAFCPDGGTTRGQTAVFLSTTFGW